MYLSRYLSYQCANVHQLLVIKKYYLLKLKLLFVEEKNIYQPLKNVFRNKYEIIILILNTEQMNISSFYNLGNTQSQLEFIDVKLHKDNLLFLDPRLIELSQNPLIINMQHQLEGFLSEVIDSIKTSDSRRTEYLLSGLSEPKETRLGYSHSNSNGNSVGNKLKPKLESALKDSILLKYGILNHLGDFDLFIEDVGCDRISDITTKIIKPLLIKFTQEQCRFLGIPMVELLQKHIFDLDTLSWTKGLVELPVYLGKPIIFIPKCIVRRESDANSNLGCFYRFAIRHFIANDVEMIKEVDVSGKNHRILKRDIKKRYPFSKVSSTEWIIRFPKLLVNYKTDFINQKLRALTDDEIEEIIYDKLLSDAS